ncbi:catalase, partial [Bacillus subtilis]|uniref:catalase n=1 Tax=Bacillus subtilis TaxID=1423 RepID=UPI0011AA2EF0
MKYHFQPNQGIPNLTHNEPEDIQRKNFNHPTHHLYHPIQNADYPHSELYPQIITHHHHPQLHFHPLHPTKLSYKHHFPSKPI